MTKEMLKFRPVQRGKKSLSLFSSDCFIVRNYYSFVILPSSSSENETRLVKRFNVRNVVNYRELRQVEEGRLNFV